MILDRTEKRGEKIKIMLRKLFREGGESHDVILVLSE